METIPAPLYGKRALVTGGSRGIGKAIAETFARHGATHIAITYRGNKAAADETLGKIHKINPKIKTFAFSADVCEPDSGRTTVEQTLKGLGVDGIDIVVSNAALLDPGAFGTIADLTKETWDKVMTALAWTPFLLARESSKVMPQGGRIILISSGASKLANGDPIMTYGVGKAAMDAVGRNLAASYGVEKGITVNSISVGATSTETLTSALSEYGEDFEKMIKELSLLKRIGNAQEVADIVAFVASPQASWIHGNHIPANGGSLVALQG